MLLAKMYISLLNSCQIQKQIDCFSKNISNVLYNLILNTKSNYLNGFDFDSSMEIKTKYMLFMEAIISVKNV